VFCNNKIISSAVSIIYAIFAAQYNDDLNWILWPIHTGENVYKYSDPATGGKVNMWW
jgi:hypothetical protein